MNDREILIPVLESALLAEEERTRGKSLLAQGVPGDSILSPLADAIGKCQVYQAIAGHVMFTANSGFVLDARSLALPLLYRAEWTQREGRDVGQAADWLIRMLSTRQADGTFTAVIWGLSIDREAPLTKHSRIMPFAGLPDSHLKKRILDRAQRLWNDAVWLSQRHFDLPDAAIVRKVTDFPYIRTDAASFWTMNDLETEAHAILVFLQGRTTGQPLALGYWFRYDDENLDLNSHENYMSWMLPEIVPSIVTNVAVDVTAVRRELEALFAMPDDWRNDLRRSLERFTLSQCRHQVIDRILDLTLAFEIAVSGKGEPAPQSWKVSVRSAQMIGGSLRDRQEHRRKMVALYNLRNQGTHGSNLTSRDRQKHETILTEATALYRMLLNSFWNNQKASRLECG